MLRSLPLAKYLACLSTRWVRSLCTVHELSRNERKLRAGIRTRSSWVLVDRQSLLHFCQVQGSVPRLPSQLDFSIHSKSPGFEPRELQLYPLKSITCSYQIVQGSWQSGRWQHSSSRVFLPTAPSRTRQVAESMNAVPRDTHC